MPGHRNDPPDPSFRDSFPTLDCTTLPRGAIYDRAIHVDATSPFGEAHNIYLMKTMPRLGGERSMPPEPFADTHHPHVHAIVPGGGLSSDGTRRIACRSGVFLPVKVLPVRRALDPAHRLPGKWDPPRQDRNNQMSDGCGSTTIPRKPPPQSARHGETRRRVTSLDGKD
jgi:hypothetical protein